MFFKLVLQEKIIYHQTLIPSSASYIDSCHTTTADQLAVSASSVKNVALLKVSIIPAVVMRDSSLLIVEITVAHDVSIGQGADSDIRHGVSDGIRFIGFEACGRGIMEVILHAVELKACLDLP